MEFCDLKGYLDNIDHNLIPSCRMKVYRNHDELFSYFSARDDAKSEEDKQLYFMYSMSKPILACAAMQLIERGIISLDDDVAKYLPEFKELYIGNERVKAKNSLKIVHLLTMQGGLTYDLWSKEIRDIKEKSNNKASTRQVVAEIAKMPLKFEPGTNYQYSLCHDVMAAVIEVASGKTYYEYLKENILLPLGMLDTSFKATNDVLERMHAQYRVDPVTNIAKTRDKTCAYTLTDNYESGGAGIISSIDDYVRFADAFACGGNKDGFSLLKQETVELMTKNHLCEKALNQFISSARFKPYGYGLGVRTHVFNEENCLSSIGEFGWDGAAGSYILIDPKEKLSVVYTQHVHCCGYAYDVVHPALRNIVYSIIK